MIEITQRANDDVIITATVTLPMEKRVKSRLRVILDDGREAGIFLERGDSLQHGDKLLSTTGDTIEVRAAEETLSIVYCDDQLLFARACYHLGNRHVPVQIVASDPQALNGAGQGAISYLHDHVLDDMLRGLGLTVQVISAPFSPEPGAYGGGHRHSHDDDHSHSHHHHGH